MMSGARNLAASVAFTAVASASALAQADSSVRFDEAWRPLLGCWASVGASETTASFCIVPTRDLQTVDVVSALGNSIISRTPLSATGARIARTENGCTGFETGSWSADRRRLFTHAEFTCSGGRKVSSDGMFAMMTPTRFTRIEAVPVSGGSTVRVRTYMIRTDARSVPASLASLLPSPTSDPAAVARMESAADVTPADVAEAARFVEPTVVETWLAMRGQLFGLTTTDTRALRQAHVREGTITAMVSGFDRALAASAYTAHQSTGVVMKSGFDAGDSNTAFTDYIPYWLYQMGVGSSYDSYRANRPCFGSVACNGLFNASTGEFFVKHPQLRPLPMAASTVSDNALMGAPSMSMQNSPVTNTAMSTGSPTITGKP